jgi:AcrR family transcriptional regulator
MPKRAMRPTGDLAPRNAPVQARGRRSIARILEAAHVVLRRDGSEAATTVAFAAEAGVAVGSLYHYFPNKEAVILALYEEKLTALRAFTLTLPGPAGDWRGDLRAWILAIKAHELKIGFDFALFDAVQHYARLNAVAHEHADGMAKVFAARLRALGSGWSDAALYDVALNAFFLNASSWLYWQASGGYAQRATDRLADAVIAVVAPALEGDAEPEGPHLKPRET